MFGNVNKTINVRFWAMENGKFSPRKEKKRERKKNEKNILLLNKK